MNHLSHSYTFRRRPHGTEFNASRSLTIVSPTAAPWSSCWAGWRW